MKRLRMTEGGNNPQNYPKWKESALKLLKLKQCMHHRRINIESID